MLPEDMLMIFESRCCGFDLRVMMQAAMFTDQLYFYNLKFVVDAILRCYVIKMAFLANAPMNIYWLNTILNKVQVTLLTILRLKMNILAMTKSIKEVFFPWLCRQSSQCDIDIIQMESKSFKPYTPLHYCYRCLVDKIQVMTTVPGFVLSSNW